MRYESSRGHKIDGINQTGDTFGDKQGWQTKESGQESSEKRASSQSTTNRKHKHNLIERDTRGPDRTQRRCYNKRIAITSSINADVS